MPDVYVHLELFQSRAYSLKHICTVLDQCTRFNESRIRHPVQCFFTEYGFRFRRKFTEVDGIASNFVAEFPDRHRVAATGSDLRYLVDSHALAFVGIEHAESRRIDGGSHEVFTVIVDHRDDADLFRSRRLNLPAIRAAKTTVADHSGFLEINRLFCAV